MRLCLLPAFKILRGMVTHVTEFCCRFPHNVINATKGETAAVNIDYALEESLDACRNLVETLLG